MLIIPTGLIFSFSFFCFYISFAWTRILDSDRIIFKKSLQKLYIDRGKYTGSNNRVIKFKNIAQLQIIEYVLCSHGKRKPHNELNLVMINHKRINLLTSHQSVVDNAKTVSRFIDRPVKSINYGDIKYRELMKTTKRS